MSSRITPNVGRPTIPTPSRGMTPPRGSAVFEPFAYIISVGMPSTVPTVNFARCARTRIEPAG